MGRTARVGLPSLACPFLSLALNSTTDHLLLQQLMNDRGRKEWRGERREADRRTRAAEALGTTAAWHEMECTVTCKALIWDERNTESDSEILRVVSFLPNGRVRVPLCDGKEGTTRLKVTADMQTQPPRCRDISLSSGSRGKEVIFSH